MTYISKYSSPVGMLTIASDGKHIIGLWMDDQKYFGSTLTQPVSVEEDIPVLQAAQQWLDCYFAGLCPSPSSLPILLDGTPFQKEVWMYLLQIPYGETVTYGEIAAIIAEKHGLRTMSSQAVGNAVGKNPVSIIIPCHRVVGSKNKLTGYAGGIDRKKWLLALESSS